MSKCIRQTISNATETGKSIAVLSLSDVVVAEFEGLRQSSLDIDESLRENIHPVLEDMPIMDHMGDLYDGFFINKLVAGATLLTVSAGYHLLKNHEGRFPKAYALFDYLYHHPEATLAISVTATSGIVTVAETFKGIGTADVNDVPAGILGAIISSSILYYGLFRKSIRNLKNESSGTLYYLLLCLGAGSVTELSTRSGYFPEKLTCSASEFLSNVSPRFTTYPVTTSEVLSSSYLFIDSLISKIKNGMGYLKGRLRG